MGATPGFPVAMDRPPDKGGLQLPTGPFRLTAAIPEFSAILNLSRCRVVRTTDPELENEVESAEMLSTSHKVSGVPI